jgi:hypothetical protein
VESIRSLHRQHTARLGENRTHPEGTGNDAGARDTWLGLSVAEWDRLIGLREDLDSIGKPPAPVRARTAIIQEYLLAASAARQAGEWDKALERLRRSSGYVEPALLAYMRGTIWMEAGDHATAALFFAWANQLEPTNPTYSCLYRYVRTTCDRLAALAAAQEPPTAEEAPSLFTSACKECIAAL